MGVGKPIFFIDFCNYIVYNLMILFRLQRGTYMENNVTSGNILKHIAFFAIPYLLSLNCKMKLELRNWDKGACPFIPIRAAAGPLFSIFL